MKKNNPSKVAILHVFCLMACYLIFSISDNLEIMRVFGNGVFIFIASSLLSLQIFIDNKNKP